MYYIINKLFYCQLAPEGLILAPPNKELINISEGIDEYLEFLEIFTHEQSIENAYVEMNKAFYVSEAQFDELLEFSLENNILKTAKHSNEFRLDEFYEDKYSRQINTFSALPNISTDDALKMQQKLINSKVAIVGVGGVGSYLSLALTMMGIEELILVDKDLIELSNTSRQVLYDEEDIGKVKIDVAEKKLKKHNSKLVVHTYNRFITDIEDLDFLKEQADIDFLVLCADQPRNKIHDLIDIATSELKIPWLVCGPFDQTKIILGPMIIPGETKTYREMLPPSNFFSDERVTRINNNISSAIIDPFNGMAAKMASVEVLKYLTGYADVATKHKSFIIDTNNWEIEANEL